MRAHYEGARWIVGCSFTSSQHQLISSTSLCFWTMITAIGSKYLVVAILLLLASTLPIRFQIGDDDSVGLADTSSTDVTVVSVKWCQWMQHVSATGRAGEVHLYFCCIVAVCYIDQSYHQYHQNARHHATIVLEGHPRCLQTTNPLPTSLALLVGPRAHYHWVRCSIHH